MADSGSAPEFDVAFFGGDPDNFEYPRYCLDMSLFRVYEDGKPLQVKNYLPWSTVGTKEGEPVFTSGHPGATQRLNTVAHLEYLRDHALPLNIEAYGRLRDALVAYGKQGAEQERQVKDLVFGLENALKSYTGQLGGLKDPATMTKKRAAEDALRAAVTANADLKARYGGAWEAVAKARNDLVPYSLERALFESGLGFFTEYFTKARTLLRWAEESQKPNGQRLPEYADARKPQIEREIGASAPIYPGMEKARLAASLAIIRDKDDVEQILVLQNVDDVVDVHVEADLSASKMTALAESGQRGREHHVPLPPKERRDFFPEPPSVPGRVNEDEGLQMRGHDRNNAAAGRLMS